MRARGRSSSRFSGQDKPASPSPPPPSVSVWSWWDRGFFCCFVSMACIAFFLELPFYATHNGWTGKGDTQVPSLLESVWQIYFKWDPIFAQPPAWLWLMCWIEVCVFGPLYVASAYVIWKGRQRQRDWILLPFSGALLYSTVVYFGMEFLEPVSGTNLVVVVLVNIPWSILPIAVFYHRFFSSKSPRGTNWLRETGGFHDRESLAKSYW